MHAGPVTLGSAIRGGGGAGETIDKERKNRSIFRVERKKRLGTKKISCLAGGQKKGPKESRTQKKGRERRGRRSARSLALRKIKSRGRQSRGVSRKENTNKKSFNCSKKEGNGRQPEENRNRENSKWEAITGRSSREGRGGGESSFRHFQTAGGRG